MRFFVLYPTNDKPSGGHKQLRLQATLLREIGVEAVLLRDEKHFTRTDGFDDNAYYGLPVETAPVPFERAGEYVRPDDVILLPEAVLETALRVCDGWAVRVAVDNQNGFFGLRYGPPRRACRRIEFALANAPYVAALCRRFYGLPPGRIFHVPHWVVRPPFDPAEPDGPRRLAVCYMPRKLPEVVREVRRRVEATHPDVPWVEIDGVPEAEVARRLRANRVFFAAQDLEGCPLTALEAMACGAVVAGFPGTARFRHPYAEPANGFWAPDRDAAAAAAAVGRAIDTSRAGGDGYEAVRAAGRATAGRYTREAMRAALAEVARVVPARAYADRAAPDFRLTRAETVFAYKLLYDYDRLGWPGRMLGRVARLTRPLRR